MKKILSIALALALGLTLFAVPALAEDADGSDASVTAVGNATVTLTPDMARFTTGVSTQDTQVANAQAANATAMQSVIDTLKTMGIDEKDIQTDNYNISPIYDYQSGKFGDQQILKGYMVSNNVTVTVRKLDQLPSLLDAMVAAGANQSYGVQFLSSQNAAAYDQALAAATQDALRKTKLIAQALGKDIGDVLDVSEANDVYVSYESAKNIAFDSAAGTPIQSGTITVSANVRIEAELR